LKIKRALILVAAFALAILMGVQVAFAKPDVVDKWDTYLIGFHPRLHSLYQQGQHQGAQPNGVAKVGDSLTWLPRFATRLGTPEMILTSAFAYLDASAQYFKQSGSWERNSTAASPGYRATDLLTPSANPNCPTLTVLECEYSLIKPAYAVILIGSNDVYLTGQPATPLDVYQAQLHQIVDLTLARGIIPILNTIPPRCDQPGGGCWDTGSINSIIRNTAAQYRVPLIDLNAALNDLPNHGLATDNLHLSVERDASTSAIFDDAHLLYGANVRNLVTLKAMDWLCQLLRCQ
jgi:lysophospholipase L1-like esterase